MEEKMNKFICIDIGGTAIKSGILAYDGTVLFSQETPTMACEGGRALAHRVQALARDLRSREPSVCGIAISTAGVVHSDLAEIIHASDAIPGYTGINYRKELESLKLPVEAENDVNCAGLSEYAAGSARGAESALILTVGTGIGGCFIQNGQLLHGHTYAACEVGYVPLPEGAFQDVAAAGDKDCQTAINLLCARLGQGIASLCFVLNPEVVVLGGGIMAQEAVLRQPIEASFAAHAFGLIARGTRIEFAKHQNAAGMKGALVHFLTKHPELAR